MGTPQEKEISLHKVDDYRHSVMVTSTNFLTLTSINSC